MNSLTAAAMYYGLWKGVDGAANITQFYVWFSFTISIFMMSDDVVRSLQEKIGLPVIPEWLDGTVDFLMVAALAWHGWMWSAAAFVVHMLLMSRMRTLVPSKKEVPNAALTGAEGVRVEGTVMQEE